MNETYSIGQYKTIHQNLLIGLELSDIHFALKAVREIFSLFPRDEVHYN